MKRVGVAVWRFVAGLARPSARRNASRLRARGEAPGSFTIREARTEDLPTLVHIHVTMWNATYAPFFARGPGYATRERQWREAFSGNNGWFCFVVERPDGELVGFAQANRSDNPEFAGELRKIYLLRDYQRLGLGRRLVGHVARRFLSQDITSMWLWGDARNPSARARLALGGTKTDDDSGNGNYGWRDIQGLASIPP